MNCTICGKPQAGMPYWWSNSNSTVSPWCTGHTLTVCPHCRYLVADGYHTPEQCQQLRPERQAVPQAFYEAFAEGELL